jgi:uncharacterized membrane protein AbrB (regulator of aidB expression)
LLANFYLFLRNRKLQLHFKKINWIVFLIFIEILSGIMMYYLDFPFGTQTISLEVARGSSTNWDNNWIASIGTANGSTIGGQMNSTFLRMQRIG